LPATWAGPCPKIMGQPVSIRFIMSFWMGLAILGNISPLPPMFSIYHTQLPLFIGRGAQGYPGSYSALGKYPQKK